LQVVELVYCSVNMLGILSTVLETDTE